MNSHRHCREAEGRRGNLAGLPRPSRILLPPQRAGARNDVTGKRYLAPFVPFVLGLLVFSGCVAWKPVFPRHPGASLPESYHGYYDYPAPQDEELKGEVVSEEKTDSYLLRTVEIPLKLPPVLEPKDPDAYKQHVEKVAETDQKTAKDLKLQYVNRIDYYLPRNLKPGQKRPVILISPILGGNMVVDHFAAYYAGRGYIAALVYRKRTLWEDDRPIDQVEDYLRTSVIRLRGAVDWLVVQPEIDPHRIGAFGVSYGAVLHTVLAAVEPRIKYHVLAMPAAPLPEVIVHCPDKALVKLVKKAHQKYGWSKRRLRLELGKIIKTDPIYLAPYVPRQKVQVYIAIFDRVVGVNRSFRLWKALGKPELKILPFGHYGGVFVFPLLQTQSYLAFKKHLGRGASNPQY